MERLRDRFISLQLSPLLRFLHILTLTFNHHPDIKIHYDLQVALILGIIIDLEIIQLGIIRGSILLAADQTFQWTLHLFPFHLFLHLITIPGLLTKMSTFSKKHSRFFQSKNTKMTTFPDYVQKCRLFWYKNVDFQKIQKCRPFYTKNSTFLYYLMMKSINHHKPTMGESIRGFEITIFVPDKVLSLQDSARQDS